LNRQDAKAAESIKFNFKFEPKREERWRKTSLNFSFFLRVSVVEISGFLGGLGVPPRGY
jgi:hypothetical protein